jgi:hypothetical protein
MAWSFGDSFDLYAAQTDAIAGYWDSGTTAGYTLVAGRFAGSQAVSIGSVAPNGLVKSSTATTDPVHHIVVAYFQVAALSGTTLGLYFQLSDGATNQCCIVFRSDGAILLTSATPSGTVLDTYTGAVTAQNTWFAFEFEIVINGSTGSWAVRKNGSTSNDHAQGGLNTRPGTNTQANKLSVGMQASVNNVRFDDVLWRSDASSVPWVGDIRCYARMPSTTTQTQFSVAPNPATNTLAPFGTGSDVTANARYTPFAAAFSGTVGTIIINVNTGFTGNLKCTIFSSDITTGNPAAILGSATNIVNPVTGNNTCTFGTPVTVSKGVTYWFGVSHDVTAVFTTGSGSTGRTGTGVSYASFPSASPTMGASVGGVTSTVNITPSNNAEYVNEAQQDGLTSYVYDSTVNDADFYTIGTIASTPTSTIAVTARAYMQKSDAGSRTAAVQIKSGGTTVASSTLTLTTGFQWTWRTDTTDPNTGAAWGASAVNAATIGPRVIS